MMNLTVTVKDNESLRIAIESDSGMPSYRWRLLGSNREDGRTIYNFEQISIFEHEDRLAKIRDSVGYAQLVARLYEEKVQRQERSKRQKQRQKQSNMNDRAMP